MKIFLLLFLCVFSTVVSAKTYYVAPTGGSDIYPGTKMQPWATWGKAFNSAAAGDTEYFRGGIYYMPVNAGDGYELNTSGTVTDSLLFLNYPDEVPILDGSNISTVTGAGALGVVIYRPNYIRFRGLVIRYIKQIGTGNSGTIGIALSELHDVTIDNITAYGAVDILYIHAYASVSVHYGYTQYTINNIAILGVGVFTVTPVAGSGVNIISKCS